jgi:hypothetical protein
MAYLVNNTWAELSLATLALPACGGNVGAGTTLNDATGGASGGVTSNSGGSPTPWVGGGGSTLASTGGVANLGGLTVVSGSDVLQINEQSCASVSVGSEEPEFSVEVCQLKLPQVVPLLCGYAYPTALQVKVILTLATGVQLAVASTTPDCNVEGSNVDGFYVDTSGLLMLCAHTCGLLQPINATAFDAYVQCDSIAVPCIY